VKTLHLLRHAKSSWEDTGLGDHERPLAPRGQRAAKRMAEYLAEQAPAPLTVLCSSARRARETLTLIAPGLGPETTVEVEEELYGATAEELLDRLRRVPEPTASVMLIGHNPGLQDLALSLARGGPGAERVREKFPTGALATLETPVARWRELGPRQAELVDYVVPREL
jgi:phosphohistidine phosphatase